MRATSVIAWAATRTAWSRAERGAISGGASVVFTVPPLASVGLQEAEARQQGLRFRVRAGDTSGWYSSRRVGEETSGYKVLVEEDSGNILGAHLLGAHAEELIDLFAMAIRFGIKASELRIPGHADQHSGGMMIRIPK